MPVRRLLKRGCGCEFKGFTKRGADFEAKIRGVNSVSGENLHDFEIISPASGVRTHPRTPPAYGPVFNVKSQRVIFPRYSALVYRPFIRSQSTLIVNIFRFFFVVVVLR